MMPKMENLPESIKIAMNFIDRIGFPVLAFLLMFYLCFKTMKENTLILGQVKETLVMLNGNLTQKADRSHDEHQAIMDEMRRSDRRRGP